MIKFVAESAPTHDGGMIIAPIITCDHCGEEITEARLANVAYRVVTAVWLGQVVGNPVPGEPIFLHKKCHRSYEEQVQTEESEELWFYEMQEWFRLLENNVSAGSTVR